MSKVFFKLYLTGAYGVPSKFGHAVALSGPFRLSTQNQVFTHILDFIFLAKIRLQITNIRCGVSGNLSEQE